MKKRVYFFPFTFAVYPALSLVATNVAQVELVDAIRSMVVSLLFSIFVFTLLYIGFRHVLRAALLSSVILILFFSYGHVYQYVEDVSVLGINIGRHRYLLGAWLVTLLLGIRWVRREHPSLLAVGVALNVTSVVLCLIPVLQILAFESNSMDLDSAASPATGIIERATTLEIMPDQASVSSTLPDIYYIILDMYTRDDILEGALGFDNSPFLDRLAELGFYVASCSQSNYGNTVLSLAASLNLDYFQNLVGDEVDTGRSAYTYGRLVKNNRVREILEGLDYTIVAFESGFSPTEWKDADIYVAPGNSFRIRAFGGLNPFETMFLRTSLGVFLFEFHEKLPYSLRTNLQDYPYFRHRERILFALDEIERVADLPGPKFVFVHILAPHNPFVFSSSGEFVRRDTPFTLNMDPESDTWQEFTPGYLGEIIYLNARIESIVADILANADTPPVIILQADHGIPRFEEPADTVSILNAIYLLRDGEVDLYPSISPVNTFRHLFDTYFGTSFGLLDDVSYFSPDLDEPMHFEIVPEKVGACSSEGF